MLRAYCPNIHMYILWVAGKLIGISGRTWKKLLMEYEAMANLLRDRAHRSI